MLVERQRFAQGGAEPALLLSGIDAGFNRGLVPDRSHAGGGYRRPGGAGRLRQAAAIGEFFRQQFGRGQRALPGDRHVGADARIPERCDGLLDRHGGSAVRPGVGRPGGFGAVCGAVRRGAFLRRRSRKRRRVGVELAPVQRADVDVLHDVGVVDVGGGRGFFFRRSHIRIVINCRRLRRCRQHRSQTEAGHQHWQPCPAKSLYGSHCPPAFQVPPRMRSFWCEIMAEANSSHSRHCERKRSNP